MVQLSAYSSIHDRKKRSRSNKNQQDGRIVSLRCPRVNGFHAPQSAILVGNVDLVLGLGQDDCCQRHWAGPCVGRERAEKGCSRTQLNERVRQ